MFMCVSSGENQILTSNSCVDAVRTTIVVGALVIVSVGCFWTLCALN